MLGMMAHSYIPSYLGGRAGGLQVHGMCGPAWTTYKELVLKLEIKRLVI